ncbi:MAG: histidinol-phosphate transaminase [Gammaproteobacteria bacterium]|nr:histidinol-phosphate transaminase [Gammaproteobacteria bacterium]
MSVLHLARPELLGRNGYQSALSRYDLVRLHANEMAHWDEDQSHGWNRYPPARPLKLMNKLAQVLGTDANKLLLTRGSNEGIDLLVRAFCTAGQDRIATCSPTFGMYHICAQVQNAGHMDIPLDEDFDLDVDALCAIDESVKLVFLCSPGNPSGALLTPARIQKVCRALARRAIIVLDEAYLEFATEKSAADLIDTFPNLVILRTFSKAYGLAGLRCGLVMAGAEIIALLDTLLPPYATPTPTIEVMCTALTPANLDKIQQRIARVGAEKNRLEDYLQACPGVSRVYPSSANFILARFYEPEKTYEQLVAKGILVRRFDTDKRLAGCLRITVGNAEENQLVCEALQEMAA